MVGRTIAQTLHSCEDNSCGIPNLNDGGFTLLLHMISSPPKIVLDFLSSKSRLKLWWFLCVFSDTKQEAKPRVKKPPKRPNCNFAFYPEVYLTDMKTNSECIRTTVVGSFCKKMWRTVNFSLQFLPALSEASACFCLHSRRTCIQSGNLPVWQILSSWPAKK